MKDLDVTHFSSGIELAETAANPAAAVTLTATQKEKSAAAADPSARRYTPRLNWFSAATISCEG